MEQTIDHNVHGWLMNVPNYRQEQYSTTTAARNIEIKKKRPMSVTSNSSEGSVDLNELIDINFTTSMEEEVDLSELSLLDLDDSKEDFWKVENIYIPSPTLFNKKPQNSKESISSFQKGNKQGFTKYLDISCNEIRQYDTPENSPLSTRLRIASLPVSPKSPKSFQNKRSGSISSETSINSQSTITPHRTKSTSTSSFSGQLGALPRSTIPITENSIRRNRQRLSSSISENTSKAASDCPSPPSNLVKRATHIPAFSTIKPSIMQSIIPQRTKSSIVSNHHKHPQSMLTQARPQSQIFLKSKKTLHISPPQRCQTSLGVAPKSLVTPKPTASKTFTGRNTLKQIPKSSNLRLDSTRSTGQQLASAHKKK